MSFFSTKKTVLIVVVVVVVLCAPVVLSSRLRRALITQGPLKEQYLRYSKWRYNWRGPSDVGDGKNALEVIIEGPMGIGEDRDGNIILSDREGKFAIYGMALDPFVERTDTDAMSRSANETRQVVS